MFTFKKLALVGAAGLAAFTMSCSDDEGDDVGGVFNPVLTATEGSLGVVLGGKIIANEGAQITSVKAQANDKDVVITGLPGFPVSEVNLTGVIVSGICNALNNTTSISNLKITVIANFSEGSPVSDSKTLSYSCLDASLTKHLITLSKSGSSFGDVDAGKTYSMNDLDKPTSKLIDLIANIGTTSTPEEKIYTPSGLPSETEIAGKSSWSDDIFWDLHQEACVAAGKQNNDPDGCEGSPYSIGGWVIPSEGIMFLKEATKVSQIAPLLNMMELITNGPWTTTFEPTVDTGFLLVTSENKRVAVIVTEKGTELVKLSTTSMP